LTTIQLSTKVSEQATGICLCILGVIVVPNSNTQTTADAGAPPTTSYDANSSSISIIADEPQWRLRPHRAGEAPMVTATRWRSLDHTTLEVSTETSGDCHVVAIVLRTENVRFSVSGRTVHVGIAMPGMLHVTEPAAFAHCVFHGPFDVLHLHVPNSLIAELGRDVCGRETATLCARKSPMKDAAIASLAQALLSVGRIGGAFGQLYADAVGITIAARLLAPTYRGDLSERPKAAALAKWRLRRTLEYVEANLGESVRLADMASVTGLSRMHFAAQFRAATGLRPHEYLLRRRIERAQEKLAKTDMSLVDVAQTVGFHTQAHFSSVFKRVVGQPPQAWRVARTDGFGRQRGVLK
jgi:AraC family transcriptional regulator